MSEKISLDSSAQKYSFIYAYVLTICEQLSIFALT